MTPDELRRLRKVRGVSAYAVAHAIGVSAPTVYRWEGSRRRIHSAFAKLLRFYFEGKLSGSVLRSRQQKEPRWEARQCKLCTSLFRPKTYPAEMCTACRMANWRQRRRIRKVTQKVRPYLARLVVHANAQGHRLTESDWEKLALKAHRLAGVPLGPNERLDMRLSSTVTHYREAT